MATGGTPVYGDGQADPATIPDEATGRARNVRPGARRRAHRLLRTALARDAAARHHTAEELRSAWLAIFAGDATTEPDASNDELAARAMLSTPLRDSGLTARALSALEPYRRGDGRRVADRRPGAPVPPAGRGRRDPAPDHQPDQGVARSASGRPGPPATGRCSPRRLQPTCWSGWWRRPLAVARRDRPARARRRDRARRVRHARPARRHLDDPVTPARATQLLGKLQEAWAADADARGLLDRLADAVTERLAEAGLLVLATAEAVAMIAQELGGTADTTLPDERVAAGLLRLTVERMRALGRADADVSPIVTRRRHGRVVLMATEPYLLDLAEWAGREADTLVAAAGDPATALVPARRVAERMQAAVDAVAGSQVPPALREPTRLAQLGAAVSSRAALSAGGDLHSRDLRQSAALALTFKDFAGGQPLTPQEIRDRVRVRFPALAPLPQRPALDALVHDAGLALLFDDVTRAYRNPQGSADTTGLESRLQTGGQTPRTATTDIERRLDQSIRSRSFLALGVPAHRLRRLAIAVQDRYAATLVDVTGLLIEELRSQADKAGLPWDLVRAADAAPPGSRDRRGLAELVKRSWDSGRRCRRGGAGGRRRRPGGHHRGGAAGLLRQHGAAGPVDRPGNLPHPGGLAGRAADQRHVRGVARRPPGAAGRAQPVRRPRHDVD